MLDNKTIIKVTNRDGGSIGYTIPDLNNLKRHYAAGETKEITMEELRKLAYINGGMNLIRDCMLIHNEEAVKEILNNVEPEYYYGMKEVKDLLQNGSVDALKDCLDYAPEGTIELVKQAAIDLEIPDMNKRTAIKEATGLDVTKAIEMEKIVEEASQNGGNTIRRLDEQDQGASTSRASGRRVAAPSMPTSEPKIVKVIK